MRSEIDFVLLQDLFVSKGLQQIVDIIAAEVRVAVGGEDLVDVAFAGGDEFENGNIESAATQVVNGDMTALLFVLAIGERGSRWLVDESQHFKAGELAGVFGGLTLRIVEIRGNGDDGAVDDFVEKRFSPIFQFA